MGAQSGFRTAFLVTGVSLCVFFLGLFAGYDAKHVACVVALGVVLFNLYRRPRELLLPFLIALLFAVFITNVNYYVYATHNVYLGHMNLFPLVMWTAGLLLTRECYLMIARRFSYPLIVTVILYWLILFSVEYIAYYWIGIQTTAGNPGFLGTNVLHGTPIMHIFYPSAGPVYIILIHYLGTIPMLTSKQNM